MLSAFREILQQVPEHLRNAPWILAISGGSDSVTLLHLLLQSGYRPLLAHANFGLRRQESLEDEAFVKELANKYQLQLKVKQFNLAEPGKIPGGVSLQEEARRLRYEWFQQLLKEERASLLLTAHHLEDNWETFWINLLRGAGIQGLRGIRNLDEPYFRPLLSFTKQDLLNWSATQPISWRDDSSNLKDDYLRNRIRHHVTPVMETIAADWRSRFEKTRQNLEAQGLLFTALLNSWEKEHVTHLEHYNRYDFSRNEHHLPLSLLKQELLARLCCPRNLIPAIVSAERTGSIFEWQNQVLLIDRGNWLLRTVAYPEWPEQIDFHWDALPQDIPWGKVIGEPSPENAAIFLEKGVACYWKRALPGDKIHLRTGTKKVSDLLVDHKVNRFLKQQAYLLCLEEEVIWVPGIAVTAKYQLPEKERQFGLSFLPHPY